MHARLLVLASGLVTSLLALAGVWVLSMTTENFYVMGWYASYVVPVGAILVGAVASSGYGLASWLTGMKISRGLLATVLLLQVAAYFAAQYVEYATLVAGIEEAERIGFLVWFDWSARSFAWIQRDGTMGAALGAWGYAFRALEIGGFAGGGLIAPMMLRRHPYCEPCLRYMKRLATHALPASVPVQKIKKSDLQALEDYTDAREAALADALSLAERLGLLTEAGDSAEFRRELDHARSREAKPEKLPKRLTVTLAACQSCASGLIALALQSGHGNQIKTQPLAEVPARPHFVGEVQS